MVWSACRNVGLHDCRQRVGDAFRGTFGARPGAHALLHGARSSLLSPLLPALHTPAKPQTSTRPQIYHETSNFKRARNPTFKSYTTEFAPPYETDMPKRGFYDTPTHQRRVSDSTAITEDARSRRRACLAPNSRCQEANLVTPACPHPAVHRSIHATDPSGKRW